MNDLTNILSQNVTETLQAAKELGRRLKVGQVVGLIGPLGSGKTHFAKGLAEALGGTGDDVVSPTFSVVVPVDCKKFIMYHFDFYRIQDAAEMGRIFDEEFDPERGVAVIEWFDRFPPDQVQAMIKVNLEPLGHGTRRKIRIEG